jgi:hypothetical protein
MSSSSHLVLSRPLPFSFFFFLPSRFAIMCVEVFKHLEREKWINEFQPALIRLLEDKVVNVRYNAGKSLLAINKSCTYSTCLCRRKSNYLLPTRLLPPIVLIPPHPSSKRWKYWHSCSSEIGQRKRQGHSTTAEASAAKISVLFITSMCRDNDISRYYRITARKCK